MQVFAIVIVVMSCSSVALHLRQVHTRDDFAQVYMQIACVYV